jgi:hypothetical protein
MVLRAKREDGLFGLLRAKKKGGLCLARLSIASGFGRSVG